MNLQETGLLRKGEMLKDSFGESIQIKNFLGSGGQGEVYKINYKGQDKALKWYKDLGKDPEAFRRNLENNIKKGAPDKHFLWPQAVTDWKDGTFGYVMDMIPEGYFELTDFLIGKVKFSSWKRTIDSALNIVTAFRLLHNRGQSYQDLNNGNFFINPKTGEVLIGDNDNVAPDGENTGIVGKPRYIAPEIVRGENLPDTVSDRYSLSMILFMIFCYGHPLEGKRGTPYVMNPQNSMNIYGTHPIFLYDPEDDSNRPIPGIHNSVINLWKCLPEYMKEIFIKAFSQDSLMKKRRVIEYDWLKVLVRFRSDIVRCSCGNEVFLENGKNIPCDSCGKMTEIKNKIVFSEYQIPAVAGTRIYRIQMGTVNYEDALNPVASVLANPQNKEDIRIRNVSGVTWSCTTPSGQKKTLEGQEMAPIKKGICFKAYEKIFEIQ